MRRPRRKLEVNTFPFLAVLLCAMGSFILLLMVIDRRAKIVAQNKAQDAYLARKIAYEADRDERAAAAKGQEAKFKADWQHQKDKIRAELQAEEDALARQITQVLAALAKTDDHVAGQKTTVNSLAQKVSLEDAALKALQTELASRQNQLDRAKQTSQGHLKLREQLTRDLVLLEAALRNVQERKARERPVYSLVPYKGKHGASSKPIYIEVADRGVAVHPGPTTLTPREWSPDALRRAIEERTGPLEKEVLRPGLPPVEDEKSPYLLFLVRPNGIPVYYESLQFLRGYRIDFGYELVEADWVFDFSADKVDQQAWRNATKIAIEPSQVNRPAPKGMGPRVIEPGGGGGGSGSAVGFPSTENNVSNGTAYGAGQGATRPPSGASVSGGDGIGGVGGAGFAGAGTGGQGTQNPQGIGNSGASGAAGYQGNIKSATPGASGDSRPGPGSNGAKDNFGTRLYGPGSATGESDAQNKQGNFGGVPPNGAIGRSSSDTIASPGGISGGVSGRSGTGIGGGLPGSNSNTGIGGDNPGQPQPGQSNAAGINPGAGQSGPSGTGTSQSPGNAGGAPGGTPSLTINLNGAKPDQTTSPRIDGATPQRGNPLTFRNVPAANESSNRTGVSDDAGGGNSIESGSPNAAGIGRQGASSGEEGADSGPRFGASPFVPAEKARPGPRLPALGRITGNRDFAMTVECFDHKVTLSPPGKTFDLNDQDAVEQLANLMKSLVKGRQGTVRPGEPPYRPIVLFRVHADGRRTYYSVYPRIAEFGFPMNRETPD